MGSESCVIDLHLSVPLTESFLQSCNNDGCSLCTDLSTVLEELLRSSLDSEALLISNSLEPDSVTQQILSIQFLYVLSHYLISDFDDGIPSYLVDSDLLDAQVDWVTLLLHALQSDVVVQILLIDAIL